MPIQRPDHQHVLACLTVSLALVMMPYLLMQEARWQVTIREQCWSGVCTLA